MFDAQRLANLYVAAWNETDAAKRTSVMAALWAPEAHGHDGRRGHAPLARLTLAKPEKNAAREGVRFRAAPSARARGDVVTFRWEMLLSDTETVLASGLEFLIVDDDGRILVDHPFAPV
jgi:hypothetical protein